MLPGGKQVRDKFTFPLGSRQIRIKVNPEVGSTYLGDLKFKANCVVNLRADGAIEVDRPGVKATDVEEVAYVSKNVLVGGKPAILMVQDASVPLPPDDRLAVSGVLVSPKGAPLAEKIEVPAGARAVQAGKLVAE